MYILARGYTWRYDSGRNRINRYSYWLLTFDTAGILSEKEIASPDSIHSSVSQLHIYYWYKAADSCESCRNEFVHCPLPYSSTLHRHCEVRTTEAIWL
nr:hypothetical protein [uncultured Draconibacterium sp.]